MKQKLIIILVALSAFAIAPARAQFDGARTYWPLPKNMSILSTHYVGGTANASWNVWNQIQADVDINSDFLLLGYTRSQPLFGRSIHWQLLLPVGTVQTDSPLPFSTNDEFVQGVGDPSFGATVNIFGAPALTVKEYIRHEVNFSANISGTVYFPLGQYNETEALNIGSNQWRVRFAAPMVKSIGPWIPGKRTTLEVVPSVMIIGDNDNNLGNRIEQDPTFAIEAHLTRDITRKVFASIDYTWLSGGDQTFTDVTTSMVVRQTDGLGAQTLGATLSYELNDSMRLYLTHLQTINSSADPFDLEGSVTKVSLTYAWHSVLERVKNFRGE